MRYRKVAKHTRWMQRHVASVAQLVEQGTENPRVSGSIPL